MPYFEHFFLPSLEQPGATHWYAGIASRACLSESLDFDMENVVFFFIVAQRTAVKSFVSSGRK